MSRRCWKTRCAEPPPWLAVNPEWFESSLFACTDHVGQLASLGFDVHRIDDVVRRAVTTAALATAALLRKPTTRETP